MRVLITGGSKGIGLEVSRVLAERGAEVVVAARDRTAVDEAVDNLHGAGHFGLTLDVSDAARWPEAIEAIRTLDGLVCAAGVLGPVGRIEDIDPAQFARAVAINLTGTALALHHALPLLKQTNGRAVTFSGGGATSPLPRFDAYAASKAAVVRLTENVAAEGEVEINSVAPGFVATEIHRATLDAGAEAVGAEYYRRTQEQLETGGFPASEAAELTARLLSGDARGITGRLISAQWDPWRDGDFLDRLRADPSLATLRRIDGQMFGSITA